MMTEIVCWTAEAENWPRLLRESGGNRGTVEAVIPVGVWCALGVTPDVTVRARIPGRYDSALTSRPGGGLGRVSEIIRRHTEGPRNPRDEPIRADAIRPYLDMRDRMAASPANRYFEARFPGVPAGTRLDVTITATVPGAVSCERTYALQVAAPEFTGADIRHVETAGPDDQWFVLFVQRDDDLGFDHLRVDLLQTVGVEPESFARPKLAIGPGADGAWFDLREDSTRHDAWLPLLDRSTDSVLLSVPRSGGKPLAAVRVRAGGGEVLVPLDPPAGDADLLPARLMFVNYGIQGLNDLFSESLTGYSPPRTYMEVTMSDEQALYSSRPQTRETGEPDGYEFTLEAHRYFGVRYHWAMNAGVLLLIAHDCPEQVQKIRDDVRSGLLSVSNAGYGAHRPPYYAKETNRAELEYGARLIQELLGAVDRVYYPDQRLYKGLPQEIEAYREAGVRYLVMDRSTVCRKDGDEEVAHFGEGTEAAQAGNYLWRLDLPFTCYALLIEDVLRNNLVDRDKPAECRKDVERGKLSYALRKRFMASVRVARGARRPIFVRGDDLEHASGNGWFDGNYDLGEGRVERQYFSREYQAALCWIRDHPWVTAVTTDDLEPQGGVGHPAAEGGGQPEPQGGGQPEPQGGAGTLSVSSATCPSVDPGGAASKDQYENRLHFDQWHSAWSQWRSVWLGQSLGAISTELEKSLVGWDERNELHELALLYFLACTHENCWNKEPLEKWWAINQEQGVLDPEDFVLAESLQMRNAWVFLNASLWAAWARRDGAADAATYVNAGPVPTEVRARGTAQPPWPDAQDAGLYWDHDPLPNIIIYNREVLLVLDRNGGRITHIFAMAGGRPVSVSGTFKAFQSYTPFGGGRSDGIVCDGEVLQNTVATPNHAYVAGDTLLAVPRKGTSLDQRRHNQPQPWLFPDNFNEYEARIAGDPDDGATKVTFTYQQGTCEPPQNLDLETFRRLCERDRAARAPGSPGGTVVWHHDDSVGLTKTIWLTGRTVHVRYTGAQPGHVVANEFCVDLLGAATRGQRHTKNVPDLSTVRVRGEQDIAVEVSTGRNCRFSSAATLPTVDDARKRGDEAVLEYHRLHRVLTHNLEVVCDRGGDFDYSIEISE